MASSALVLFVYTFATLATGIKTFAWCVLRVFDFIFFASAKLTGAGGSINGR